MTDLHLCIIGARLSEQTNGEIMAALGRVGLRVEQIEVCQPDELDALRKENEELRKDKDYFCTRWNEAVGMLRSVTEILREVTTDTHAVDLRDVRNILENIAQWETHWKELAAKAKESEASHE